MKKIKKIVILFLTITILLLQINFVVFADDTSNNTTVQNNTTAEITNVTDNSEETNSESENTEDTSEIDNLNMQKEALEAAVTESENQIGIVEDQISEALAEV